MATTLAGAGYAVLLGAGLGVGTCRAADAETEGWICAGAGGAYALPVGAVAAFGVARAGASGWQAVWVGTRWGGVFTLATALVFNAITAQGDGAFSPDGVLLAGGVGAAVGGVAGWAAAASTH